MLYQRSAAIANLYLTTQPECGIVYPTIAMHAGAENFALTPALADNRLQFESAKWCLINEVKDFPYTLTPLEYADTLDENGSIEWRGLSQIEKRFL